MAYGLKASSCDPLNHVMQKAIKQEVDTDEEDLEEVQNRFQIKCSTHRVYIFCLPRRSSILDFQSPTLVISTGRST